MKKFTLVVKQRGDDIVADGSVTVKINGKFVANDWLIITKLIDTKYEFKVTRHYGNEVWVTLKSGKDKIFKTTFNGFNYKDDFNTIKKEAGKLKNLVIEIEEWIKRNYEKERELVIEF